MLHIREVMPASGFIDSGIVHGLDEGVVAVLQAVGRALHGGAVEMRRGEIGGIQASQHTLAERQVRGTF
ncbi:hypothetical protein ABGA94_12140, partial [Stenotrophomonas sp. 3diitr2024]